MNTFLSDTHTLKGDKRQACLSVSCANSYLASYINLYTKERGPASIIKKGLKQTLGNFFLNLHLYGHITKQC